MSHIEPVEGEALRYRVESTSKPGEHHMVDLSLYGGSGFCSCPSFAFRCSQNLKDKTNHFTSKVWCKHIRQVRDHFTNSVLKLAVQRLAANPPSSIGRESWEESSPSQRTPTPSPVASQARTKSATAVPF